MSKLPKHGLGICMSNLLKVFGESPKTKIVDFFLNNPNKDFTKSEIIRSTRVGRTRFYSYLNDLLEEEILISSRRIGRITLYRLNTNHPLVEILLKMRTKKIL